MIGKRNSTQNPDTEKEANLVRLRELVHQTNEKITNDWAQEKLNISDSTATRYLDALEKEGLIKQIGTEGRFVYYEKA